jgi:hypothetical protein
VIDDTPPKTPPTWLSLACVALLVAIVGSMAYWWR